MPKKDGYVSVNTKTLIEQARARFIRAGVPCDEAEIIAQSLVEADMRGVYTHGIVCASRYIDLMKKSLMRTTAEVEVARDLGAIAVWDAKRSNAQVVGHRAMMEAVRRAKEYGVSAIAVRGGNHFGAAAYYSMLASREGMIGVTMSTGASTMAPWGGADRLIGNNPLAVAVPCEGRPDIVLDMAQSVVAFGRISNMKRAGEKYVPAGWALDSDGAETIDINRVHTVMPMSTYKGFGAAVIIDILSGILFGGATGARAGDSDEGPSMLFMAFDIAAFGERKAFESALCERVDELKGSKLAPGAERIYMPGEIEARNSAEADETIWIMPEILDEFLAIPE